MEQFEREFDELFKSKGGRHSRDNSATEYFNWILENSRNLVSSLLRDRPNLPEPFIDIVDNNAPNAFASKKDGKYFIGISSGAISLVYDIFISMMSSESIFKDVGDITVEIDRTKFFEASLTEINQLGPQGKSLNVDLTRILFAQQLIKMVFEFLICHEYAHILLGHVDYLHSVLGNFEIEEMLTAQSVKKSFDCIVSQTIEVDADMFATDRGVDLLDFLISNPGILAPELTPFFKDWQTALKVWIVANYTFFRIFSNQNIVEGIKKTSHPPPAVRSHLVLTTICKILQPRNDIHVLDRISKICIDTATAVEGAFEIIFQTEKGIGHLTFINQTEASEQADFLIGNIKILRPILQPYSYLPENPT